MKHISNETLLKIIGILLTIIAGIETIGGSADWVSRQRLIDAIDKLNEQMGNITTNQAVLKTVVNNNTDAIVENTKHIKEIGSRVTNIEQQRRRSGVFAAQ